MREVLPLHDDALPDLGHRSPLPPARRVAQLRPNAATPSLRPLLRAVPVCRAQTLYMLRCRPPRSVDTPSSACCSRLNRPNDDRVLIAVALELRGELPTGILPVAEDHGALLWRVCA